MISWNPVEGREYSVWYPYNLQYVDFELLKGGMGYPINTYTDIVESAESCRMYKVGVQLIE